MNKRKRIQTDICDLYMRNRHGYVRTYGAMRIMLTSQKSETREFANFLKQYPQYRVLKIGEDKVYYKKE